MKQTPVTAFGLSAAILMSGCSLILPPTSSSMGGVDILKGNAPQKNAPKTPPPIESRGQVELTVDKINTASSEVYKGSISKQAAALPSNGIVYSGAELVKNYSSSTSITQKEVDCAMENLDAATKGAPNNGKISINEETGITTISTTLTNHPNISLAIEFDKYGWQVDPKTPPTAIPEIVEGMKNCLTPNG